MRITVTIKEIGKMTLNICDDLDMDETRETLRVILAFVSWAPEQIEEILGRGFEGYEMVTKERT